MNREQARALIGQTFTQAFDKSRFQTFIRNLLNHVDESKASAWSSQYVKDAFKQHVQRYERLGTYASPDKRKVDILAVHLTEDAKLERARTAIRNFVADHLKSRDEKDAALVAFVPPSATSWRFSYIKMEYESIQKVDTVGVETHLTPARRLSYLVGEGESCHTAQARFIALLQDTEADPPLSAIEDAFSVEAVTKEFFGKYAELFTRLHAALEKVTENNKPLRDEFREKRVNPVDFAKKLLGQIVFLYFLQKKGWLGVARGKDWGTGPRDFLRRLANGQYGQYGNFFNDIIEPLFYDTLATDRGHEAWCSRFKCRIPFLNGGLFEPLGDYSWRNIDILLPNLLFTNTEPVDEGITGTGILDVFDRYNFTVNEAEPLEKEVAIDPEMLGKVFENLIEENRRKGLGSFYTPREIVHYMCQESIITYLDTTLNTRPESIAAAVLDQNSLFGQPEGKQLTLKAPKYTERVSRADIETFVHLGEQISHYEAVEAKYAIKMPKDIETNARLIDGRLAEITVCDPAVGSGAFPVGMMTEIVRARSALTPYFNDVQDRTPYHFKRHAIQNCLYGVDIDPGAVEIAKLRLWLSLVVDEEEVKQIKPLPNLDFKIVSGNSLVGFPFKSERLDEIEKLKTRFFEETDHRNRSTLKVQIDHKLAQCFAASRRSLGYEVTFDFGVYFSEVFRHKQGFDIVIANPPYVRQEKITDLKPALKAQYECFDGIADLLVYFYERGVKLLHRGGTIALITSNKYYRAGYGEKLRVFLSRELTLNKLVDFGDAPVFEAVAYASILVGVRAAPALDNCAVAYTWEKTMTFDRIAQIVPERGQALRQSELKAEGWLLEAAPVLRLLEQLRRIGKPLREYVGSRVYRGITTGFNEAFVIDRPTRDRLVSEHKASAELLKPYLRGRDVKRWRPEARDQWIIFTRRGVDIGKYPAVHKHLLQFKRKLMPGIKGGRKPGNYEWHEIQDNIAYWRELEHTKIISTKISIRPTFAIDANKYYLGNTSYFISAASSAKYVLGVLNSSVFYTYARRVFVEKQGGWFEVQPDGLEAFPIPDALPAQKKSVELVVDRILAVKQRDSTADVSALEREIDQVVFKLYDLTPQQIAIVERAMGRV